MQHSEQLDQLATALAAAQAELDNVTKDAKNPHFRSDYATLDAITDTVRPVLAKHGLSVTQLPGFADGVVTVDTMLMHKSGQWLQGVSAAPVAKADPQGVGSATTYLRRYSLAALCAIAQTDDDGNAASGGGGNGNGRSAPAPRGPSGGDPFTKPMPFGKTKGTALGDHTEEQLLKTLDWCRQKDADKFADLIADIETVLAAAGVAA